MEGQWQHVVQSGDGGPASVAQCGPRSEALLCRILAQMSLRWKGSGSMSCSQGMEGRHLLRDVDLDQEHCSAMEGQWQRLVQSGDGGPASVAQCGPRSGALLCRTLAQMSLRWKGSGSGGGGRAGCLNCS
ncbi:hypothetical protein J6590_055871 [Homalodisca vitripennis]|nr:hypothetical protein J6590_055871 [Homalodisca vitripennis]